MSFRLRSGLPLVALLVLTVFVALATPAVARADSLSWTRAYSGPQDIPNGDADPIPVAGGFNAVSFGDALNGWAVGVRVNNVTPLGGGTPSTLIAKSTSGGLTWVEVDAAPMTAELNAVFARSATDVWVAGKSGTIAHLQNGVWSKRTITGWVTTKAFNAITFTSATAGWAVGDGGGIARTIDGGLTWSTVITPGSAAALRGLARIDDDTAMAVGDSGTVVRLGGAYSPPPTSSTSNHLYGVTFTDSTHGWAVGGVATVIRTVDGGVNWEPVAVNTPAPYAPSILTMRSVAFADANAGMIVGRYQMAWRTFDGGATWSVAPLQNPAVVDNNQTECGVAFVPGSADHPVTVERTSKTYLAPTDKARAFVGNWSDRIVYPAVPTGVTVIDGGSPRPSIRLIWTDASTDEDGFVVQRAKGSMADAEFSTVVTLSAGQTTYLDITADWRSTWYYRVKSFRGDVSSAWAMSAGLSVDAVAPTTETDALEAYIGSASFTLYAADNTGGSGVTRTRYRLDADPIQTGTMVTSSVEGTHVLEFWSEDVAGNVEVPRTVEFTISNPTLPDGTAPVSASDAVPSYEGTATIRFNAADEPGGSGVAATWYTLNGGNQTRVQAGSVEVTTPGTYALEFWSIDAAANTETHTVVSFAVTPLLAPVTTSNALTIYGSSARIALHATDGAGVGVAHTYCQLDSGAVLEATSMLITKAGAHTLRFRSVDALGNVETTKTVSFTIVAAPSSNGTPSTPSTPSTVRHGASFTTYGYLIRHTTGTYPVTLYFYRYQSGHWVLRKSITARATSLPPFSKYYRVTSVPYSGRWRVRARHTSGGVNRYSSYRYFTAS